MCLDAEISDPQLSHSNSNNDSRLTKVGHFIRAYHLVKLPQLYNALRGYMALIEPHPERKFYIDQIMEHDYSILISIRSAWAYRYYGKNLKWQEYDLYYLGYRS